MRNGQSWKVRGEREGGGGGSISTQPMLDSLDISTDIFSYFGSPYDTKLTQRFIGHNYFGHFKLTMLAIRLFMLFI